MWRDKVGRIARIGKISWPVKVRRLGSFEVDAPLQVVVSAVQIATVDEAMQIAATNRRAHEVLYCAKELDFKGQI